MERTRFCWASEEFVKEAKPSEEIFIGAVNRRELTQHSLRVHAEIRSHTAQSQGPILRRMRDPRAAHIDDSAQSAFSGEEVLQTGVSMGEAADIRKWWERF